MGDDAVKGYIVKALEELDENDPPKLEAPAAVVAAPPKPTPPPPPAPRHSVIWEKKKVKSDGKNNF